MKILQVCSSDISGGAEKIALELHQGCLSSSISSWLAVGDKKGNFRNVVEIPNDAHRSAWARIWTRLADQVVPGQEKLENPDKLYRALKYWIGQPNRFLQKRLGHENFDYPGAYFLLGVTPEEPDILHCHNLHGDYFDLRALPYLSAQLPLVLTLHDAWLLSGHCAHSFDCDRWQSGCGNCPYLSTYPALRRDATVYNWQRKRAIYQKSHLFVATPSQWLMDKVNQSILATAVRESRVIPNGVDLETFKPANQAQVREKLNLPANTKILLFTANTLRQNPFKDFETMRRAVAEVARGVSGEPLLFLALGEDAAPEYLAPNVEIRFVPYQTSPAQVAAYYQAANIYIHAAKADTFPTTILEALACGTPVVATSVSGIPEQVDNGKTGWLVPIGNSKEMAEAILSLLENPDLHQTMSQAAREVACQRFGLEHMVGHYRDWYREILKANHV